MENVQNEPLYKVRSYTACVINGVKLFTHNFKLLFKYLWPIITIMSIVIAVYNVCFVKNMMSMILSMHAGSSPVSVSSLLIFICSILIIITEIFFMGHVFTLLNKYKELSYFPTVSPKLHKKDILHYSWKSLKGAVCNYAFLIAGGIVFFLIFSGLSIGAKFIGTIIASLIGFIAFVILAIPFIFIFFRYMINDNGYWSSLGNSFKMGLKHWSKLFIVLLIVFILLVVMSIIVYLPIGIIYATNILSVAGVINGDPSGLPESFGVLVFFISLICSFVFIFLSIPTFFPIFFAYGSIETEEKEKKQLLMEEQEHIES